MKKIFIIMMLLILGINAESADFSIINESKVITFIKIMPSYRALLKKYGAESQSVSQVSNIQAEKYYNELAALVSKFGLKIEDFFTLFNRIISAYPLAKMKAQGVNYPSATNVSSSLSAAEMNILLKYLPQLDKVLEEP